MCTLFIIILCLAFAIAKREEIKEFIKKRYPKG